MAQSHCMKQLWSFVKWTIGNKLCWNLNNNTAVCFQENNIKKYYLWNVSSFASWFPSWKASVICNADLWWFLSCQFSSCWKNSLAHKVLKKWFSCCDLRHHDTHVTSLYWDFTALKLTGTIKQCRHSKSHCYKWFIKNMKNETFWYPLYFFLDHLSYHGTI